MSGLPLSPGESRRFMTRHLVWMGLYLALVALGRWWVSPALEYDEAEQALHLQHLMGGYGAQPPGFEWMVWLLSELGIDLRVALPGLKALLLWLVFAATVALVRDAAGDARLAVACGYAVFLLPQLAWEAPRTLTHTVMATACLAVGAFVLQRLVMRRPHRLADTVLLGLVLGAGLLSKHSFTASLAFFALALLWRTGVPGGVTWMAALGALALGMVVASPHLAWLAVHGAEVAATIQAKMAPSSAHAVPAGFAQRTAGLLLGLAGFGLLPALLIVAVAWVSARRDPSPEASRRAAVAAASWRASLRGVLSLHALLFLALGLLLVTLGEASRFRDRWLTPFLFLTPALLVVVVATRPGFEDRLIRVAQVYLAVVGAVLIARVPLGSMLDRPGWLNVPAAELAAAVRPMLPEDAIVLVDTIQVAGGLKAHLPAHRVYQAGAAFTALAAPRGCEFLLVHAVHPAAAPVPGALAALREAMVPMAAAGMAGAVREPLAWKGALVFGTRHYEVHGERWRTACPGRLRPSQRPDPTGQRGTLGSEDAHQGQVGPSPVTAVAASATAVHSTTAPWAVAEGRRGRVEAVRPLR